MKKPILLLCCLSVLWNACEKHAVLEVDTNGITHESPATTRSFDSSVSPVFEWYNTSTINMLGQPSPVVLPWYTGANTQIPYGLLTEYLPEHGWEMVYNYCIEIPPAEIDKNYLIFYNKFTGILRVFYHNRLDVTSASTTFWKFELTSPSSLLNAVGQIALPMSFQASNPSTYISNLTSVPSKSITKGWNCFDVELSYDNLIHNTNANFNINVYNQDVSTITINGSLGLEHEGSIVTTMATSSPLPWTAAEGAKIAGEGAKVFMRDSLLPKKGVTSSAITSMLSGGTSALVQKGIQLIVGSLLGKKSAAVSYDSQLKMTSTGTISMTGQMTRLNNPNISTIINNPLPGSEKSVNSTFLPSYDTPLGVWNIENDPLCYISSNKMWGLSNPTPALISEIQNWTNGVTSVIAQYHEEYLIFCDPASIKVKINPAVLQLIDRYEVEIFYVYNFRHNNPQSYNEMSSAMGPKGKKQFAGLDSIAVITPFTNTNFLPNGFIMCGPTLSSYMLKGIAYEMLRGSNRGDQFGLISGAHTNTGRTAIENDFLVKVMVTLYPKNPYDPTPVISCRTYKPKYAGTKQCENWGTRF